tara:strand:- start:1588 stop:2079 length:492 start_codon:yes stop_codon:yes gene_type:complete
MHRFFSRIDEMVNFEKYSAHCDIPCKIYDPIISQIAALSVVRLIDIIAENEMDVGSHEALNLVTRCVVRKEEEAEKVKTEIRTIWGDYFKSAQFEKYPEVHSLVHTIMMKASACKQSTNRSNALELVDLVNEFAAAFWDTKAVSVEKKICPYPPNLNVVYPVL